jgi:hypothetical protein
MRPTYFFEVPKVPLAIRKHELGVSETFQEAAKEVEWDPLCQTGVFFVKIQTLCAPFTWVPPMSRFAWQLIAGAQASVPVAYAL